jgi:hypothetical protein
VYGLRSTTSPPLFASNVATAPFPSALPTLSREVQAAGIQSAPSNPPLTGAVVFAKVAGREEFGGYSSSVLSAVPEVSPPHTALHASVSASAPTSICCVDCRVTGRGSVPGLLHQVWTDSRRAVYRFASITCRHRLTALRQQAFANRFPSSQPHGQICLPITGISHPTDVRQHHQPQGRTAVLAGQGQEK